jgi:hypothetical protein
MPVARGTHGIFNAAYPLKARFHQIRPCFFLNFFRNRHD